MRHKAIALAALLPVALAATACGGTPEQGATGSSTTVEEPAIQGPPGPPGSILEGGRSGENPPEVSGFEVPPKVPCAEGETASVPVSYQTTGATTIAFMLDFGQVEGEPPLSGTFNVPVPCDGDAHTIVLFAVGTDSSTNTVSKVTVAGG